MSLFYTLSGISNHVLENVARELQFGASETIIQNGASGFVWNDWDAERFSPAKDPITGTQVIISGRLALSREQWRHAKSLPYSGGLASRIILERYLSSGVAAVAPFNGAAVVIVEDKQKQKVTIWTDQFGYHPCFIYESANPLNRIITTFPDLILCDPSADHSPDLLSMAEFLRGWRTTPPHTYYSAVKHAGAATRTCIDLNTGEMKFEEYWKPFETDFYPSVDVAAEELAANVEIAIKERTDFSERPIFMVSGGADSRALLFSTEQRSKVTGVNLYERFADETKISESLCKAAGSNFVAFQRDKDFYPENLADITKWSGAMWSAEDSHYLGFAKKIEYLNPDLLMTACTTDWLFKGYGLEKKHRRFLGKNLPFYRLDSARKEGFLPNVPSPAPDNLEAALKGRLENWFAGRPSKLKTQRDYLLVEDRRVRPTCYAVSVSGQIMTRTYPYDTFLADSRIADCYSRITADWKINGEVWGKAVALICADAENIVDSNYGWRVDANMREKTTRFAIGWLQRKTARTEIKKNQEDDRAPSNGSWPDCGWYAKHSPTLADLWENAPAPHRELIREISGEDPWDRPLSHWQKDGHRLMRISTLLAHWKQCEQRKIRSLAI
jgi:hypothetical protein